MMEQAAEIHFYGEIVVMLFVSCILGALFWGFRRWADDVGERLEDLSRSFNEHMRETERRLTRLETRFDDWEKNGD